MYMLLLSLLSMALQQIYSRHHVQTQNGDPLIRAPSSPFKKRPNILFFLKKTICLDFRRRD